MCSGSARARSHTCIGTDGGVLHAHNIHGPKVPWSSPLHAIWFMCCAATAMSVARTSALCCSMCYWCCSPSIECVRLLRKYQVDWGTFSCSPTAQNPYNFIAYDGHFANDSQKLRIFYGVGSMTDVPLGDVCERVHIRTHIDQPPLSSGWQKSTRASAICMVFRLTVMCRIHGTRALHINAIEHFVNITIEQAFRRIAAITWCFLCAVNARWQPQCMYGCMCVFEVLQSANEYMWHRCADEMERHDDFIIVFSFACTVVTVSRHWTCNGELAVRTPCST